ncbi:MAG: class I SAM-dependent methyltransferase [Acidiferrobacteraceae bacterium]
MVPDYSGTSRATSRQLPVYTRELIEHLTQIVDVNGLVVEIGANDGTFLEQLRAAGYKNLLGIEPSVPLGVVARAKGFRIESSYFGPDIAKDIVARCGHARMIVCRHTLEHVPDPLVFMNAIAQMLHPENGLGVIEVPDATVIWDGLSFFELWDQHLFYFDADSLGRLMVRAGLMVCETQTRDHLETRNLITLVRPRTSMSLDCGDTLRCPRRSRWMQFRERVGYLRGCLGGVIHAAQKPVYLIGASHPQMNFVNFLDIGRSVSTMIDDDPEKVGRIVPICNGNPSIIATDQFLRRVGGGTVVSTGFGYPNWSERICAHARITGMAVIDPRTFIMAVRTSGKYGERRASEDVS